LPPRRAASARGASGRRLYGKIALITGGNRGIGLTIARALANEGCELIITGRDQVSLRNASKELVGAGIRVLAKTCDVRDPASIKGLMAEVKKRFRRLDILINNAGVAHQNCNIEDLPLPDWKEVIETNLTGTYLMTQAALPLMEAGATIVNNLSIAATRVFPGSSAYNTSKHGALGFTNTLREELRPKRVRVIALMPGATDTTIWNTLWPDAPREKMMQPETIAAALVSALVLPANSTVEELKLLPTGGTL
jgi:NAD(P)-dependent dehydrogenase (short-subunit alcohol dehydrogenase family)